MHITHQTPLSLLTTMRLGGQASEVVTCESRADLETTIVRALEADQPYFVIGGGSNIIARDEGFDGSIILNRLKEFEVIKDTDTHTTIRIGAGESWDETVRRTVDMGLSGIEAMSAIPGTAGATPVQNVGAYGQEIADTFVELEAYDTNAKSWAVLTKADCQFSYRSSIFKDPAARHHVIASITLQLNKAPIQPPFYDSLQRYLDDHHIDDHSPQTIRDAVTAIRATKLPDPSTIANTGSFFKNPIVDREKASKLIESYPDMPHYPMPDGSVKLAAGWLMEQSGLKNYEAHGFGTYEHNALVVVNKSAHSYQQLAEFKDELIQKVATHFGVTLEQEPETL